MSDTRDMRTERDMRSDRGMRSDTMERDMPVERERSREDRRPMPQTTTEPMRTNPEATPKTRVAEGKPAMGTQMDMWPDMDDFRQRFEQIQSEFIDDPKSAVKKAEHLIEEAVERITKTMRERMQAMHRDVDEKDGDTEQLRLTMRSYRMFIESMGSRRAA